MIKFLPLISTIVLLFACEETKECCSLSECEPVSPCTEIFVSVTMQVVDEQDNPVQLDYIKTVNTNTGTVIHSEEGPSLGHQGYYRVLDDLDMDKIMKEGSNIRFEGGVQDAVLVDEVLTIGHDCCHLVLVEGKTKVVIN
ncbi:MAG: hypothetical protein KI790_17655 [Cyclobacteriaceae bacterium]|nr:hypothetical protein [Cyclobacteriaceae bacterium HetDA_MAG_MS6]